MCELYKPREFGGRVRNIEPSRMVEVLAIAVPGVAVPRNPDGASRVDAHTGRLVDDGPVCGLRPRAEPGEVRAAGRKAAASRPESLSDAPLAPARNGLRLPSSLGPER